ncbi:MAG: nitroreductase family protein, partial [Rhodoferax sp.]|nr:nitroreductase family protein [Rhodoferax sp.]
MPSPAPGLHPPHRDTFAERAQSRRSVRAFLPTPLPDGLLHSVLQTARLAPSGANLQPGSFIAVQGQARAALSAELVQCFRAGQQEVEDYAYFPRPL